MKTTIQVNNQPVVFERNPLTGHFTYRVGDRIRVLQHALNPLTHISFRLSRDYTIQVGNSTVQIIRIRPLEFSGFRPHHYKFFVDGDLVREIEEV